MKVLLTGATGFIGNYVVDELLKYDLDVIGSGLKAQRNIHTQWLDNITYIQADLNESRKDWFSYLGEPDMLIHLSWQGLPNYKEQFHISRNLPNNYSFLNNMIENGLKKVAVVGTCLEYGMQSGELKEDLEPKPDNPYAIAKDCLRKLLEQLQKKIDFNLKWIRLFYIYGKGQSSNSILSQLEAALERNDKVFHMSGGEQLRDYLTVEKVAQYIVRISMQDKVKGIINCCSGEPITVNKLVRDYLMKENKKIELNLGYYSYPEYEPMAFWGNKNKLNKALGILKSCN